MASRHVLCEFVGCVWGIYASDSTSTGKKTAYNKGSHEVEGSDGGGAAGGMGR